MKKMLIFVGAAMLLALPMVASANLVGDCYDCHTMHNSEQNAEVVVDGNGNPMGAQADLLRFDCLGCHAQAPTTGGKNWTGPGGSVIPQVAHAGNDANSLAGGNFNQTSSRKVHSVSDMVNAGVIPAVPLGENANDQLPGTPHMASLTAFTSPGAVNAFDAFTCAGARGCHGTRAQLLGNNTGSGNSWEQARRTGLAAVSGAHHNNMDTAQTGSGYNDAAAVHSGAVVAQGYRFIVGLRGLESTTRENTDENNHNEYYGDPTGIAPGGAGCAVCHVAGNAGLTTPTEDSGIASLNNSMSGFCSSCHGIFHSAGAGGDYENNGVAGAFLRHPSDYIIPDRGEYQAYDLYDVTAPVARQDVRTTASSLVEPGTDMVMCLSCHVAHGSENDYLLRFDYATMTAGFYGNVAAAQAAGGCLACHTEKGVLPANR